MINKLFSSVKFTLSDSTHGVAPSVRKDAKREWVKAARKAARLELVEALVEASDDLYCGTLARWAIMADTGAVCSRCCRKECDAYMGRSPCLEDFPLWEGEERETPEERYAREGRELAERSRIAQEEYDRELHIYMLATEGM